MLWKQCSERVGTRLPTAVWGRISVARSPCAQVVVEGQKKGSDSAINNGGKRPGLVGASPTEADIELTPGEREQEDEEAAIEER